MKKLLILFLMLFFFANAVFVVNSYDKYGQKVRSFK